VAAAEAAALVADPRVGAEPEGTTRTAHGLRGAGQQGRQVPKGAEFQTSRNPKSREIPNGARTAPQKQTAPFARPLEFGAVWNSAPLGIQRLLGFRDVVALRSYQFSIRLR